MRTFIFITLCCAAVALADWLPGRPARGGGSASSSASLFTFEGYNQRSFVNRCLLPPQSGTLDINIGLSGTAPTFFGTNTGASTLATTNALTAAQRHIITINGTSANYAGIWGGASAQSGLGFTANTDGGTNNAIRVASVSDDMQVSTPSAATNVTMIGWFRMVTDRNTFSDVFSLESAAATEYNEVITDADGTTLAVYDHTGRLATVGVLTVGVWYKVAFVVTSGAYVVYLGTEGTNGVTSAASGAITNVGTNVYTGIAGTQAMEWFNGRVSNVRVWNAALSETEIEAEFASPSAVRTSNLLTASLPYNVTTTTVTTLYTGTSGLIDGFGGGAPVWATTNGPVLDNNGLASVAGSQPWGINLLAQWGGSPFNATSRYPTFVGLRENFDGGTGCRAPSTLLNTAYVGCDYGQNTLYACTNDASGSATCTDLGASFPCLTDGVLFNTYISLTQSSATFTVENVGTGTTATVTTTTDLPQSTAMLGYDIAMCTDAGASSISYSLLCVGGP